MIVPSLGPVSIGLQSGVMVGWDRGFEGVFKLWGLIVVLFVGMEKLKVESESLLRISRRIGPWTFDLWGLLGGLDGSEPACANLGSKNVYGMTKESILLQH